MMFSVIAIRKHYLQLSKQTANAWTVMFYANLFLWINDVLYSLDCPMPKIKSKTGNEQEKLQGRSDDEALLHYTAS